MEFIFIILLALWVASISSRVSTLERKLKQMGFRNNAIPSQRTAEETIKATNLQDTPPPVPEQLYKDLREAGYDTGKIIDRLVPAVGAQQTYAPSQGEEWADRFFDWLKKDFMVKVGAFLLILALGWFVSYAIANQWIGPEGQIAVGLLIGAAFMALGIWRIETHMHQGGIFTVLGSTMVLMTTFAARQAYELFTPTTALFIMALSVVFVAFVSVRYNRNTLALASLILAGIAPLLTHTPAPSVTGLFTYLTVVVLATLWIVYLRGWSNLTFSALLLVTFYGLPYLFMGVASGDRDVALLFSFLFTAIFFFANIVGLIANESEENRQAHIFTGVGTGLYLIAWITAAADPEWRTLLYVAWMLVFTLGSFIVYRAIAKKTPFYIYAGTSVALLGAATASQLSGPVLTLAFTFEITALIILTAYMLRDTVIAQQTSVLLVLPILLSLPSVMSPSWNTGIFHNDFAVLAVLMLALLIIGRVFFERMPHVNDHDVSPGAVCTMLGSLYGLMLIWLVLHSPVIIIDPSTGTTLSLVVYTLLGLGMYFYGTQSNRNVFSVTGGLLLGFVVMHLLVVEVWMMERIARIITFVIIGLLLISTAFVKRSITNRNEGLS